MLQQPYPDTGQQYFSTQNSIRHFNNTLRPFTEHFYIQQYSYTNNKTPTPTIPLRTLENERREACKNTDCICRHMHLYSYISRSERIITYPQYAILTYPTVIH